MNDQNERYRIQDLIDLEQLQASLSRFSKITGFTTTLVSHPDQQCLISTGQPDICTRFHRNHLASCQHCLDNNTSLARQRGGQATSICVCDTGLVVGVTPIIINGQHIASLLVGRVLLEIPDPERFGRQARNYGHDESAYLETLDQVPVVTQEQLENALAFLNEIVNMIVEVRLASLKAETLADRMSREAIERRQAEAALQESEAQFRELADLLPQIVYETNTEGILTYANRLAFDLFGYTRQEFEQGLDVLQMIIPEDRGRATRAIQDTLSGRTPTTDHKYQALTQDGSTFPVDIYSAPIVRQGHITGTRGIIVDITEQEQAEKTQKLNAERMEALLKLNQMHDASIQDITDFALEQAVRLTGSQIGYLAFMNEDESVLIMHSWSRGAMQQCAVADKPIHYPVETTGLWGEAVRQRRPIVTNDYVAPNPWKKGYPEGHVSIHRHMNVPVFSGPKIVIVAGVGNKETDYDDTDSLQLTLLMEGMWQLLEQQRAAAALANDRELLRTVIDNLPDLVYVKDMQGRHLLANTATMHDQGWTQPEDFIGKTDFDLYSEQEAQPYSVEDQVVLAGQPIFDDIHPPEPPFSDRWWSVTKVPLRDSQGEIIGLVGILGDITRQKQDEQRLRESEEKYRVLFASFPLGITITDRQGNILEANRESERLLGLSIQEHLGRQIDGTEWHIIQRDGQPMPKDRYASVRALNEHRLVENTEMGVVKPDGEVTWLSVTAAPIPLQGYGVAITYSDITERLRTQNALQQERDLSRALAGAASVVGATLDPDQVLDRLLEQIGLLIPNDVINIMRIEGTRASIVRWRGYKRFGAEAFVSTTAFELDQVPTLRQMVETQEPAILSDVTTYPGWVIIPELAWVQAYAGAPICVRGEVIGFLNIDSATKNAFTSLHVDTLRAFANHAAIALENARLYHEAQRELAERKRLEAQLIQAQKMEAVGRLAGGVAHDFNNHLTAINGYAELLLLSLDADDPRREDAIEIRKAAERSTALTRQLLAFSRKQMIQPQVITLNTLVADIETMLQRLIGENIALVTALDPSLWQVRVDPGQMEQVIMNLAVNARDAMPYGGRLLVETANERLESACNHQGVCVQPGEYVLLTVSDNGVGMDQETMSHLFEPFFTTKERGKGTGLGLATVYGIVKQNQGYVLPYSKPGAGTTFKIYLPGLQTAPTTDREHKRVAKLHGGQETILLVEDDASVRTFAQRVLKQSGYAVIAAENADQAHLIAQEHAGIIDLLLTDVVMPGNLSGKRLAEQLEAERDDLRVLYMSGYTDNDIVQHGVLETGIQFLNKPFTAAGLTTKVRAVLDTMASEATSRQE
ncbi:MAG: PAS domain S-box protein [Anaerolineae bacterium]|nr:PAS domain S-box protein [Anaerolineae bacterium]